MESKLYTVSEKTDTYSCVHGTWFTTLESESQQIATKIRVVVPSQGTKEIWQVSLRNLSNKTREIALYAVFGFYDHGVMGGECYYDDEAEMILKYAVPYHVRYEDFENAMKEPAYFYMFSDDAPDSYDMSKSRFFGGQGEFGISQGVQNGTLSCVRAEAEDFCGAMQYTLTLSPGETREVCIEAGAAVTKEEVLQEKKSFHNAYIEKMIADTKAYWDETLSGFYMKTPDASLNAFGNYWLKKQITLLTRQNRGSSYCPVRNQLQDALGYSMLKPVDAQKYIFDVMKLQNQNGYLKQWYDTNGASAKWLCLLNHSDAPVWLVICAEALLRENGDSCLEDKMIPYADGGSGSVLEHMERALLYLKDSCGSHGLCLIHDGDWTDPINGVGREGKGESVWLSEAFIYAVRLLLPYLKNKKTESFRLLEQAAENMKEAINQHVWCGDRYALAIHDDGSLLGSQTDRLFLNTQSWAIMAGVADEQKTKLILETVNSVLGTPFGPLLLYPPFEKWDSRWGRLSVKKSGTTENGSVYCHASMFYAFAEAVLGDGDGLYETLWRTLPTNPENAPDMNLQIPIYLSNYYYGLKDSVNFGRSSGNYGTGTVGWMLMLLEEQLLGLKSTVEGLKIAPCLPKDWNEVFCEKKYRNALYRIHMVHSEKEGILVNGQEYTGEWLPYEEGKEYEVEFRF